jgi:hypothetical protein
MHADKSDRDIYMHLTDSIQNQIKKDEPIQSANITNLKHKDVHKQHPPSNASADLTNLAEQLWQPRSS